MHAYDEFNTMHELSELRTYITSTALLNAVGRYNLASNPDRLK